MTTNKEVTLEMFLVALETMGIDTAHARRLFASQDPRVQLGSIAGALGSVIQLMHEHPDLVMDWRHGVSIVGSGCFAFLEAVNAHREAIEAGLPPRQANPNAN